MKRVTTSTHPKGRNTEWLQPSPWLVTGNGQGFSFSNAAVWCGIVYKQQAGIKSARFSPFASYLRRPVARRPAIVVLLRPKRPRYGRMKDVAVNCEQWRSCCHFLSKKNDLEKNVFWLLRKLFFSRPCWSNPCSFCIFIISITTSNSTRKSAVGGARSAAQH